MFCAGNFSFGNTGRFVSAGAFRCRVGIADLFYPFDKRHHHEECICTDAHFHFGRGILLVIGQVCHGKPGTGFDLTSRLWAKFGRHWYILNQVQSKK